MADAGFRLTVEGEKEFKAALASIDQQIKINKAQIKLLTQEYNLNEDGMQTLTTKQSVLQSRKDCEETATILLLKIILLLLLIQRRIRKMFSLQWL